MVCSCTLNKNGACTVLLVSISCPGRYIFLYLKTYLGRDWHSHTVAVFCWAWPVNPFSWITWCSLTRSRSSWWLRRSDPFTCRLPPPPHSSLCWCPPLPRTVALSTACRCQSRSRCQVTTHSHRVQDNQISLCTLAPPLAPDQVQTSLFVSLVYVVCIDYSGWLYYKTFHWL